MNKSSVVWNTPISAFNENSKNKQHAFVSKMKLKTWYDPSTRYEGNQSLCGLASIHEDDRSLSILEIQSEEMNINACKHCLNKINQI